MKNVLLIIFFFSISKISAQQTPAELENNLKNKVTTELFGINIPSDVHDKIYELIQTAKSSYQKNVTQDNYNTIIQNFSVFLNELKNYKKLEVGSGEMYYLNKKSYNKAKKKICPLYPFC